MNKFFKKLLKYFSFVIIGLLATAGLLVLINLTMNVSLWGHDVAFPPHLEGVPITIEGDYTLPPRP